MTQSVGGLDFKFGMFCDDVRHEANGKQIIIGVYSRAIVVPKFPARLKLAVWAQFSAAEPSTGDVEFRLHGDEDLEFHSGGFQYQAPEVGIFNVAIPLPLTQFQSPVHLAFQIRGSDTEKWVAVAEADVTKGPIA